MLMNRALTRAAGRGGGGYGGAGRGLKKKLDPTNPKDIERLRALHPDFDEVMFSAGVDYKTQSQTDANFASKYKMPPALEPTRVFREHTNSVDAVCWGPEPGQFISASHDKTLKVWDAKSGMCLDTLAGHSGGIYHCAVASNRKLVMSCGSGSEKNVLLWQWPQKKVCMELKGHRRSVIHATFAPDCQSASTVDQDGNVLIHDTATGKCTLQQNLHLGTAQGSSFCQEDPNLLCTAGVDGFIHLLDLREQATTPIWRQSSMVANCARLNTGLNIPAAHDGHAVNAVEFMGRRMLFSGGADNKLKRWDLRMLAPFSPKSAEQYLGHSAPIRSLCVAGDGRWVVSGCEDGSCRIWPSDTRGELKDRNRALREQINQLGPQIEDTSGPPEPRKELETRRQKLRAELSAGNSAEDQLSRDGYCPAAKTLIGHVSQVSGCAWQEDGQGSVSILSSSWDQSIQLFNISLQDLA